MVKKRTSSRSSRKKSTHVTFSIPRLLAYAATVFIVFILLALSLYTISSLSTAYKNNQREAQIKDIYQSLALDDSYRPISTDVFGEKRVYDWDEGRTFSSRVSYGRNSTVEKTFSDLKTRIEAAGFEQIDDVYGGVARQLHFKNNAGNYVRVSVEPKLWQDAIMYGKPDLDDVKPAELKEAMETAPVYVTVKVNLDDNNE